jgi:hypothetical protein
MPSTYTANNTLTLQAFNENPSTWGAIANSVFSLIDASLDGIETIDVSGSGATASLTIADGVDSPARARVLNFSGARTVTNITVTIGPNTAEKIYWVRNSTTGGFSVILAQGSGSTVTIAPGAWALVFLNGAGSGASVTTLTSISLAGSTSGMTTIQPSAAASGTLTLPAATDTLVGRNTTDTLTNKSIPVVSGGTTASDTLTLRSTSGAGFTDAIIFQTGTQVDRGRVDSAGRWGIATTLPQTLLTVGSYSPGTGEATTRGYIQIQDPNEAATINGSTGLEFKMSPAGSGFGWKIGTIAGNILCFGARQNSATFTEILRVTPQGNVAIGTQTPESRAHVAGAGGTPSVSAANQILTVHAATGGNGQTLQIGASTASPWATWLQGSYSNNPGFASPIALQPAGGNVGIGTDNPLATLHVKSSSTNNSFIRIDTSSASASSVIDFFENGVRKWQQVADAATDRMYFLDGDLNDGVYLGQNSTAWTANSDLRLKDVVGTIEGALDKLSQIRGVLYSWKADAKKRVYPGVIAQEVQAVLPEAIDADDPEKLGVRYSELVPLLVNAVNELATKVIQLEQSK